MIPFIQKELVEKHQLMSSREMTDVLAVCQSLPGAIAVNISAYIGYLLAGPSGAVAAVSGVAMPSFLAILFVSQFYRQLRHLDAVQQFFIGVRPAIVALLLISVIKIYPTIPKNAFSKTIAVATLILLHFTGLHPIGVILLCVTAGLVSQRKEVLRQ